MNNRSLIALSFALSLSTGGTALAFPAISDRARSYQPPSVQETIRVRDAFKDAAARSTSDRAGQIFVLPAKYNYIYEKGIKNPPFCHLDGQKIASHGTVHGDSWEYDTHIPMVLWGPGVVRANVQSEEPATQQDLVPTYAHLIGAVAPEDARGRVLSQALLPTPHRPKVILTVVFDQGGEVYYRAHPGATPFIDRLKREGTYFSSTLVTDLDAETGIGHTAIGTGAWPAQTGISSNNLWMRGFGSRRYSFEGETGSSPIFLNSPTLGDVWLKQTQNKAMVVSYCYADRAAIGMAGHGAMYKGNKKPYVIFYDAQRGQLTTNEMYYALPEYLKGRSPEGYLKNLTNGTGIWMEHPIDPKDTVRTTPAYVDFDGDNVVDLIQHEPFGQSDVSDLLYVTLKSTDTAGHAYGHESDEAGTVLREQDKQLERIVNALVEKVGKDNVLVAVTADHGSTPLADLSGGVRLADRDLVDDLNRQVDHLKNGVGVFEYASATQLFINDAERIRNGLSYPQLKKVVLDYRVKGIPFFTDAMTRDEAINRQKKFEK